jgi:hypothetical protein
VLGSDRLLVGVVPKSVAINVLFTFSGGKPESVHILVTVLWGAGTLITTVTVPTTEPEPVPVADVR